MYSPAQPEMMLGRLTQAAGRHPISSNLKSRAVLSYRPAEHQGAYCKLDAAQY